jgi:aryl-alcohol dehydrogenase-like predicted oxidoreductase
VKPGKIILGTVQFGLDYGINNQHGKPNEQTVFAILDYAFENGISTLDTADAYGSATDVIGRYHEQTGRKFIINTKFRVDEQHSITEQLHEALGRLKTGSVDTYFFHRFDEMRHAGAIGELSELKLAGLIQKTGVSVYDNHEFAAAIDATGIDVIQLPFNLLDNQKQRGQLLKKAKQKHKEIQVRSVFLQGLFFKNIELFPAQLQPLLPYVQELRNNAEQWNISMEQMALNYALGKPEIDKVLLGVDTLQQLQRNLGGIKQLPGELVKRIDEIDVKETALLYPKNWS